MNRSKLSEQAVQRLIEDYRYYQGMRRTALEKMNNIAELLPSFGRAFGVTADLYVASAGYRRVLNVQKLCRMVTPAQLESCMESRYRKGAIKVMAKIKPRTAAAKAQQNPRYKIKKRKTTMQPIAPE